MKFNFERARESLAPEGVAEAFDVQQAVLEDYQVYTDIELKKMGVLERASEVFRKLGDDPKMRLSVWYSVAQNPYGNYIETYGLTYIYTGPEEPDAVWEPVRIGERLFSGEAEPINRFSEEDCQLIVAKVEMLLAAKQHGILPNLGPNCDHIIAPLVLNEKPRSDI